MRESEQLKDEDDVGMRNSLVFAHRYDRPGHRALQQVWGIDLLHKEIARPRARCWPEDAAGGVRKICRDPRKSEHRFVAM